MDSKGHCYPKAIKQLDAYAKQKDPFPSPPPNLSSLLPKEVL